MILVHVAVVKNTKTAVAENKGMDHIEKIFFKRYSQKNICPVR